MLWDYDFRLIPLPSKGTAAGERQPLISYDLDLPRKSFKQLCERENTQMHLFGSDIADLSLTAFAAVGRVCVSGFSKNKAKTTTKTV